MPEHLLYRGEWYIIFQGNRSRKSVSGNMAGQIPFDAAKCRYFLQIVIVFLVALNRQQSAFTDAIGMVFILLKDQLRYRKKRDILFLIGLFPILGDPFFTIDACDDISGAK